MRARVALALLVLSVASAPAVDATDLDLIPPVDGPIVAHMEPPPGPYAPGHRGIDFRTPEGQPVAASAAGVVAFAGQVGGRRYVSIDHAGGLRTTYSFLAEVLVRAGESVDQGSVIARSGPGHDGGPPVLHFGLREGSRYLDPEPWLLRSMRRNLWRVVSLAG